MHSNTQQTYNTSSTSTVKIFYREIIHNQLHRNHVLPRVKIRNIKTNTSFVIHSPSNHAASPNKKQSMLILILMLQYGLRYNDLILITKEDIDLEKNTLHLRHRSSKSMRVIYMHEATKHLMAHYIHKLPADDFLFKRRCTGEPLNRNDIINLFHYICQKYSIPKLGGIYYYNTSKYRN